MTRTSYREASVRFGLYGDPPKGHAGLFTIGLVNLKHANPRTVWPHHQTLQSAISDHHSVIS